MRFPLRIILAGAICATASTAHAQLRFQGMDTNRDGVITRAEWRGNDTAFRGQDWNQDGILSGEEVRTGGRRQHNWNQDWNRDGRVDDVDTQIAQRFRGYDMNGDNRVARSEWAGDARFFTRLDTSRDGYLSMEEYAQGGGFTPGAQGDPLSRFSNIDRNNDGWVTRPESRMATGEFDRFDVNRDNRISRAEFDNVVSVSNPSSDHDRFATVDLNHDGWLVRSEWRGTEDGFTRLDGNRDNRLSRTEYDAEVTTETTRSHASQSGFERGTQEGRAAGREDHTRRQGWDLEGQRELERADSGYTFQVGTLNDYRVGYREGFRIAYRAGFTEAGGRAPR
jgi:hypothetical protein